jgi:hypothetical protein
MSGSKGSSGVVGYDEFLNHSSGGGGGSFLKSWKDDGQIDVWLAPAAGAGIRWAHSFWHVVKEKEKGGEEADVVKSYRWICHEREIILRKQRFRGDDIGLKPQGISPAAWEDLQSKGVGVIGNGSREYPPEVCPMCTMIELLREQVRTGRLSWTSPLFEWDLKDDSEIVTVGGFCGLFSRPKNDYAKVQLDAMRKAGVEQNEIFMENAGARCDYIMRVVSDADPQDGIVIAPVADSLGRKIQKAIKDRIEATKGAFVPSRDPFCVRWKYDDSKDFEKKYDVVPLTEAKPNEDVLEALEGDLPPIDDMLAKGNVATLRAQMEKHCVLQGVPWDHVFGAAEKNEAASQDTTKGEPWDAARAANQAARAPEVAAQPAAAPQAPAAPPPAQPAQQAAGSDDEPYECEVCGGANSSETRCRHCGAEYDSFTGALTYNPRIAVSATNKPSVTAPAVAAAPPAEPPPPAGRSPARRRRQATA